MRFKERVKTAVAKPISLGLWQGFEVLPGRRRALISPRIHARCPIAAATTGNPPPAPARSRYRDRRDQAHETANASPRTRPSRSRSPSAAAQPAATGAWHDTPMSPSPPPARTGLARAPRPRIACSDDTRAAAPPRSLSLRQMVSEPARPAPTEPSMAKKMLIDAAHAEETRVVVVDGNRVEEFDFESQSRKTASRQHLSRQGHAR